MLPLAMTQLGLLSARQPSRESTTAVEGRAISALVAVLLDGLGAR